MDSKLIGPNSLVDTVQPRYNEDLGTIKSTLLYQVSHYIRVKNIKKLKRAGANKMTLL